MTFVYLSKSKTFEFAKQVNNRPITYLYTDSDLIKPVTPTKPFFGRNVLYKNIEHVIQEYITELRKLKG